MTILWVTPPPSAPQVVESSAGPCTTVKIQTTMQSHIYLFLQSTRQVNMLNFEEFKTYLSVTHNKNKETTESIVRDVRMYLSQNETTESDYKKLLNIQKLEDFVEVMSDQCKPTTRAKKLR